MPCYEDRLDKYTAWLCWLLNDRAARWQDKRQIPDDLKDWADVHAEFDRTRRL